MARTIGWKTVSVTEMSTKGEKRWFLITEVGEQGKKRVRASKANVSRLHARSGETLTQLQLPFPEVKK